MNYKKSHRDQKCRPYATKAIEAGCNILEIDIQSACGKIVLGHNIRPKLPFLFDCTLEDYLDRVPAGVLVQLDVKEICFTEWGRKRFSKQIRKVLAKYPYLFFLISANKGLFRIETMTTVLLDNFVYSWSQWSSDKDITTVDLWK